MGSSERSNNHHTYVPIPPQQPTRSIASWAHLRRGHLRIVGCDANTQIQQRPPTGVGCPNTRRSLGVRSIQKVGCVPVPVQSNVLLGPPPKLVVTQRARLGSIRCNTCPGRRCQDPDLSSTRMYEGPIGTADNQAGLASQSRHHSKRLLLFCCIIPCAIPNPRVVVQVQVFSVVSFRRLSGIVAA